MPRCKTTTEFNTTHIYLNKEKKIKQETYSFYLLLKNKEEFNTNVLINTSTCDLGQRAGLKHLAHTGLAAVISKPGPG